MTQPTNPADFLKAELEAFYAGARTARLPLAVNDTVRVKEGSLKDRLAAVISIESMDPEPRYLIELGPAGGDVILPLSFLERVDSEAPIQSPQPTLTVRPFSIMTTPLQPPSAAPGERG